MKYKLPDGFENREEAMEALIKKEIDAAESELSAVRRDIEKFLLEKKGLLRKRDRKRQGI